MNTRQLKAVLIFWLFSQQLFAAAFLSPHFVMNCHEQLSHHSSKCEHVDKMHENHSMPMIKSTDGEGHNKHLSMICDHCSTVCQPSVISNNVQLPSEISIITIETYFTTKPINTLSDTLYRPPIFA